MKSLIYCGATALMLLSIPAMAQNKKTIEPNDLTAAAKRPALQITEQQKAAIKEALASENTQQKTLPKFEPKVGDTIPGTLSIDVMPQSLVQREPSLQPYGYAKTATDLLVIDPKKKTIIAIMPRKDPTSGKDIAPADWAKTQGRTLTGKPPEPADASKAAPEPAGDVGDKSNGNEQNANEK